MTMTHGEEAKVEKGEGKGEMKTGDIFKKLEFNHKRGRGDEEREEDLFVQFDKYEKF